MNIAKFLRTAFLQNTSGGCFWLQQSIEDILKQLLHSSKDNMLHNSTSADMKVYALQPKQKSTADVSNRILQNFRTTTFQNKFVGLLLKRKLRGRRACIDPCGFRFSLFPGQLLSHKTIFFLHKCSHSRPFQFGLCYPFL